MEHLPLDTREREDGQVDHHDDELAEQQRAARFLRGGEDFMEAFAARQRPSSRLLRMRQAAHAVLHDDHGAVDDDAEVQRPQAHEVGADLVVHHAREGEQHGQRDDQRRDQRRAQVAQEQEEDDHHQGRALHQVLLDRGDGLVHQVGAVVDGDGLDARGQAPVDLGHALVHGAGDGAAVLADQHEHRAQHHLAAVVGGRARAQLLAQADLGQIADADGLALGRAHDDLADVGDAADLARRADQVLLALALDIARTHVAVVALQGGDDVGQREAVGRQLLGRGRHQVLLWRSRRWS